MTDVTTTDDSSGAPRRRNPRGQGDRLRAELIDAASDLLASTGDPDQVSIRAVARAAGVSPMAAYRHFEDRDALLEAAVDGCFAEFAGLMVERSAGIDDPFERLRAVGRAYLEYANAEHGHYRVLFSNPIHVLHDHDKSDVFDSAGGSAFTQLITIVGDCLAANRDDRDPIYVSFQVWTWVHGIVDLRITHAPMPWPSSDRMMDDLQDALGLVRRAVRKPATKGSKEPAKRPARNPTQKSAKAAGH